MHAAALGDNKIELSWDNLSPSYFPITYELLVTDGITGEPIELEGAITTATSFQFTPPNRLCLVLNFSVQAFSRAGRSEAAELTYYGLGGKSLHVRSNAAVIPSNSTEPNVDETIQLNIQIIDGVLTGEIQVQKMTNLICACMPVHTLTILAG